MKLKEFFFAIILIFVLNACSSSKQIAYFQDLEQVENKLSVTSLPLYIRVMPNDKLSILVNSREPQLTELFNLPYSARSIGSSSGNNMGVSLYTVDADGNIEFPLVGTIHIAGMTRKEIAVLIRKELVDSKLLKDPTVTVEFSNLHVEILGEVNSPGRYTIDRDLFTLLDAIGMAGDLTIYGKRDKVLVIREEENGQRAYRVNLCSAKDLYASPVFYLKQNDVVYVEPSRVRANQSTINGNTVRSTAFWISLASLAASLISILR